MARFMLIGKKKGTPQNGKTFKLMECWEGWFEKGLYSKYQNE